MQTGMNGPGENDPLVRFVTGLILPAIRLTNTFADVNDPEGGDWNMRRLPPSQMEVDRLFSKTLRPSVWWRSDRILLNKPSTPQKRAEWLPGWTGCMNVHGDDIPSLLQGWRHSQDRLGRPDFIRLSVNPYERAELTGLAMQLGLPVVPIVRWLSGAGFSWHYPLRVTAAGSARETLVRELGNLPGAGTNYIVTDKDPDVCFISGATEEPKFDCGTVLAIGEEDPERLFGTAIWGIGAAKGVTFAGGVPRNDLAWWPKVVDSLIENVPLDCALADVVPGSVIGGVTDALTATTLGVEARGWHGSPIGTNFWGPGTQPDMEGGEMEYGKPPRREGGPKSAMYGSSAGGGAGTPAPNQETDGDVDQAGEWARRRLLLEFRVGRRLLKSHLPPNRDVSLTVHLGVPERGHLFADRDPLLSKGKVGLIVLDVVVSSSCWDTLQRAQVAINTDVEEDRSTSAVFHFVSPAVGLMVLTIDLLFEGSLVQRVDVATSIRDRSIGRERMIVAARHNSEDVMSAARGTTFSLDATGSELRNLRTRQSIPLEPIERMADGFEALTSRPILTEVGRESLGLNGTRAALIELARRGAGMFDQLTEIGLGHTGSGPVSILIHKESRVLPIEMVYERDSPARSARLCKHVHHPPPLLEGCELAGRNVVCPYAFWGLTRTVSRNFLISDSDAGQLLSPLVLRGVLFAASDRADADLSLNSRPSDAVGDKCLELFQSVHRVKTWTSWRSGVREMDPELLLLLAHTGFQHGESTLQIGASSTIARPDLTSREVRKGSLVLLISCASAMAGDQFGTLAGTMASRGAGAVVGMLTQISGKQGSRVAVALVEALATSRAERLSYAVTMARRDLIMGGEMAGFLLIAHGDMDIA